MKQDIKFKYVDEANYKTTAHIPKPKPMKVFDPKISNSNAHTQASTQLNPNHIENLTNFSQQYNDLGLNTHIESYSKKQEFMRMAQKNYKQNETKLQQEKIVDLETSLDINKGVLSTLMADKGISDVMKQVNDENTYLKKRLK